MGQARVSDKKIVRDHIDRAPILNLPTNFQMLDIERFINIGCPKAHLRLYNFIMRALGRDDTRLDALFPLSLSGVA